MKVELMNHTRNAAEILIFTKNTRLEMTTGGMADLYFTGEKYKADQLDYISKTIKSSWEFVDYTFLITEVDRGFTHQFVRNRTGSYAQQSMRVTDQSNFGYTIGKTIESHPERLGLYCDTMSTISAAYQELIGMGASVEDARGLLPTNIHTNIVAKFNLRSLSDMMLARTSSRTQGLYREVIDAMFNEVVKVHPWAEVFLRPSHADDLSMIENHVSGKSKEDDLTIIKAIDRLRGAFK